MIRKFLYRASNSNSTITGQKCTTQFCLHIVLECVSQPNSMKSLFCYFSIFLHRMGSKFARWTTRLYSCFCVPAMMPEVHFASRLFPPYHGFQNIQFGHVRASIPREKLIYYKFVIPCSNPRSTANLKIKYKKCRYTHYEIKKYSRAKCLHIC